jgi:lysophospholipase L1-like esterase
MIEVLCYGDSNTYGRDPVTDKRFPRDVRWPGVMQNTLGSNYHIIEEALNGRTTVWDDPVRGHTKRNGSLYLLPCLESHAPLDKVIIMLGTNDLKARFSVTAYDIAESMGYLIEIVQRSRSGQDDGTPELMIMAPPPLGQLTEYADTFSGGVEKSKELAEQYKRITLKYCCEFFDTGTVIQSSKVDGLHFDPEDHAALGKAVAKIVKKSWRKKNV